MTDTKTQDLTARTQSMKARTQTFEHQPGAVARAARSLVKVDRINDPEKRYQAFAAHMAVFPPTIANY